MCTVFVALKTGPNFPLTYPGVLRMTRATLFLWRRDPGREYSSARCSECRIILVVIALHCWLFLGIFLVQWLKGNGRLELDRFIAIADLNFQIRSRKIQQGMA